ncbi:hypothetical protein [Kineococcus terrestris]|uniref:hypothetical protein n=1 Tax=Kineococcus terrestris TaxID=2044856 RepID=UPI0034DB30C2
MTADKYADCRLDGEASLTTIYRLFGSWTNAVAVANAALGAAYPNVLPTEATVPAPIEQTPPASDLDELAEEQALLADVFARSIARFHHRVLLETDDPTLALDLTDLYLSALVAHGEHGA